MKSLRIFVVDDDVDVADSLAELLELSGHSVTTAYSGDDAVEILAREDFDLTFMDVMMPGRNGVESFIEIKKTKPQAKVVLMTGFSVQDLLDQAVSEGVAGVLHKPVAVDEILSKVNEFGQSRDPGQFVLIAHEDEAFCKSLEHGLLERGLSACIAHNGAEALSALHTETVDVLILSLRLPVISGLEICYELKKQGRIIPTIIVDENGSQSGHPSLHDPAFSGVVFKPFDPLAVLSSLDSLVEKTA